MKTATVRARIEPDLKTSVESILLSLGLSVSEAIELYMRQIKLIRGIPFEIRIPNRATIETFESTDRGENLTKHENTRAMFDKLGL